MSQRSNIEWTEATWNPVVGCTKVSPGCKNCYAERLHTMRYEATENGADLPAQYFQPFDVIQLMEKRLELPLHWKKPRRIFVNSMSDLFHEDVPDDFIDRVFAVMALCPQHTFQVLTKRAQRMRAYVTKLYKEAAWNSFAGWAAIGGIDRKLAPVALMKNLGPEIPFGNVWLGVSVEDQQRAGERVPELLRTPAAVRFISAEPLLGAVNLYEHFEPELVAFGGATGKFKVDSSGLHWVICGGESGPNARPMHPDWARGLRDQCAAAGVPFFFKQWGEWAPIGPCSKKECTRRTVGRDVVVFSAEDPDRGMVRVGKKVAGRLLDGVLHDAMPGAMAVAK